MKKKRNMRIDEDLWLEVGEVGEKLKPREDHTKFFERAAWERVERIKRLKKEKK